MRSRWVDPAGHSGSAPLADLPADPGTTKVLHSASEDSGSVPALAGVLPEPLFDTQRAAALLDIGFGPAMAPWSAAA